MRNLFSRFAPIFVLACISLLAGCAGHRARVLLAETEACIKQAESYDARIHAPDYVERARGNIKSAKHMLRMGRAKVALYNAIAAHREATEALRLSRSSKTALTLKSARDALKLVDANRAGDDNPALYQQLTSEVKSAERAYVADKLEQSLKFSQDAAFHANLLLEPLKKECDIRKKKITDRLDHIEKQGKKLSDIRALINEATKMTKNKQYRRVIKKWEKIEARLNEVSTNP